MDSSQIQDEAEVIRWFEQGRTDVWMSQEYERQYNIVVTPSLWVSFRRRKGLARRVVLDVDLIPWTVQERHRWAYGMALLRLEARTRAGGAISPSDVRRLESWRTRLAEADLVVHYDPDTEGGFCYVPRRKGVDLDVIREPGV
jgi:hypothetical protein